MTHELAIKNQSQLRELRDGLELTRDEAQAYWEIFRTFVGHGLTPEEARGLAAKSLRPAGCVATKAESIR